MIRFGFQKNISIANLMQQSNLRFTFSKELEDVLMKRNEDLLPSESICRELALLCNRVTSALEALMIDPTPGTPGIEDVKVTDLHFSPNIH